MTQLEKLTERVLKFRDERDWKQFHTPKDMAISLALEAAEVMEHFQYKSREEIEAYLASDSKEGVADELADVLYWILLMAHDWNIDLESACEKKMIQNEAKYPAAQARGSHTKHTELAKVKGRME